MSETSFKKRYIIRLIVSLIVPLVSLATQIVAPRALGPANYGSFNFLTNFFNAILNFLEAGTSVGFYTKLSQRQNDKGLVIFYLQASVIVCILMFLMIPIATNLNLKEYLWPGQKIFYIYYAAALAAITWLSQVWNKIADAYALTISSEVARLISRFSGLILILLLFYSNKLNQQSYFFYNCVTTAFFSFLLINLIQKNKCFQIIDIFSSSIKYKQYLIEFYTYSSPLVVYALFSSVSGIFDRWILQIFKGDTEQGYYSLAYQISALCFLFSASMTPILTREFAISYEKKDFTRLGLLFRRLVPPLYSITAYFSCFIFFRSEAIAKLFGGDEFKGSYLTLSLMALYPMHQTYGQLSGVLYYATNRTKLYSTLGVVCAFFSSILTFVFIAPAKYFGLGLGSQGFALKMLIMQFICVNALLYFNIKFMKQSLKYYLLHQIGSFFILLITSAFSKIFVDYFITTESNFLIKLIISGIFYSCLCAFLGWNFPWIFGTTKSDMENILQKANLKLRLQSLLNSVKFV